MVYRSCKQTFTRININPAFGNSSLGLMAHAGLGGQQGRVSFRLRDDPELRIWFRLSSVKNTAHWWQAGNVSCH